MTDENREVMRLQVAIAKAGIASRRNAEELIKAGKVKVNGIVVKEIGTKVTSLDKITVNGILAQKEDVLHYLVLNKPSGYLCSMSDQFGRPLACDLFKPEISERVYNVGRLDLDSCGLVIFTNDGNFASIVGHPSSGIIKEYYVETDRNINDKFPESFMNGIMDEGELLKALKVELLGPRELKIRLVEGKNREIRRALRSYHIRAKILRRVSIGPVKIDELEEGKWRNLTDIEIKKLSKSN